MPDLTRTDRPDGAPRNATATGGVTTGGDTTGGDTTAGADKPAFVQRLRIILAHWPSADRLARAMGVSPSAFRKWLKGEAEPSRERLVALARAAGVGIAWLAEGEGPAPTFQQANGQRHADHGADPADPTGADTLLILPEQPLAPRLGLAPIRHFLGLRPDWIRTVCGIDPAHAVLDVATDDAMAPTIGPNHLVLIDASIQTALGAGIYLLEFGGQRQIRRVQPRHDAGLHLLCDNPAYQPDTVAATEAGTIRILGRVVWAGGTV